MVRSGLQFFLPIWLGSLFLAFLSGPVGNLLIWTRTSVLAEAISHAAILGFVLHFQWPWIPPQCGVLVVALAMAGLLFKTQEAFQPAMVESLLHQTSTAACALGLIYLYQMPSAWGRWARIGLGEMMAINASSVWSLGLCTCLFLGALSWALPAILASFLEPEVAALEGRAVKRWKLATLMALAAATSLLVYHFGALLVTSILLAPASLAHRWAHSPWQAMFFASGLAFLALGVATLSTTFFMDCPTPCFLALQNFWMLLLFAKWR